MPLTSFSGYDYLEDGLKEPVWFALDDDRPPAFFAGLWTEWTSMRKVREGEVTAEFYGFLTTEANV